MSSVFEDSLNTFLFPLKEYLGDEGVSEILCNGPQEVFIEKGGKLQRVSAQFPDEQALQAAVRNIAQFVGRKIDEEHPTLDARLPDGSRIHAVLPPCSRKGTSLSIRKFGTGVPSFSDIISKGSITSDAARFLDISIFLGKNIIISGGTGSGKTTLLNILGGRVPKKERLLIIEDASELQIHTEHVVNFETKPANAYGKGEVSIRDLLRSALRLRPDRIIVGEVRGAEALDLVTAMNTGHGGSMGTVHSNSPFDALVRLETLAMMSETQIPEVALRRQIASAIHLVVQISRFSDGTRKVTEISEVSPEVDAQGRYHVRDLYKFILKGKSAEGKMIGNMIPTGELPSFLEEIRINGIPFGKEKFTPPDWYLKQVSESVA